MKKTSQQAALLKYGVRSGLEEQVRAQLEADGIRYEYEQVVIEFRQPEKPRKYTPDFLLLSNGIVVETKGRFVTADRQKHLLVQAQHSALDIRFVFSNSRQRISKQSQTTYAAWCQTKGFKYADKLIPQAWLNEPVNKRSLEYALKLMEG